MDIWSILAFLFLSGVEVICLGIAAKYMIEWIHCEIEEHVRLEVERYLQDPQKQQGLK